MAFENVFQGIDFQAPTRAAQTSQQQFLNILGNSITRSQQQAEFDKRMELEMAKAQNKPFDLQQQAQQDAYNILISRGVPKEQAAIETYQQFQNPRLDPTTGAIIQPADIMGNLGLGRQAPAAPMGMPQDLPQAILQEAPAPFTQAMPQQSMPQQPSVEADMPVFPEMEAQAMGQPTIAPTGPDFPMPQATPLPPELRQGAVGPKMQFEEKRDLNKARFQKELEFAQKKYEANKALPVISKSLDRLDELNDKLLAKQAILSGDSGIVDNLKAKWGSSWIGRETQSVTKPEVEELRQEYERTRDGLIPYYIVANDLPATVVDTEEFQQRILQSFGDPSLIHGANSAALNNMRMQFGVKSDKAPSIKEGTVIENDKGERLILKGGQWQKM
jgi:hypothetical protein